MKIDREGKATVLSFKQWREVWGEMPESYRLATQIAYYCCERIGAVVQISADDFVAGKIRFKGQTRKGTQRVKGTDAKKGLTKLSTIPPQLLVLLNDYDIPDDGYLFPSERAAGFITTRVVEKHLKRAAELCGHQGVSTHSPRRSMCTHLDEAGWSLAKIAKVSGHKSLASLEQYIDRSTAEAEADLCEMFG